jgi:hypothetical protein
MRVRERDRNICLECVEVVDSLARQYQPIEGPPLQWKPPQEYIFTLERWSYDDRNGKNDRKRLCIR